MSQAPKVLISMTCMREEEKLIARALQRRGVVVESAKAFDVAQYLNEETEKADIALIRNLSHKEASALSSLLQYEGVDLINSSDCIKICGNKAYQAIAFRREGVPVPQSYIAYNLKQVRQIAQNHEHNIVIKPIDGSWGRGVVHIKNADCMESWAGGRESCDISQKFFPVLTQEMVNKGNYDLRIVVVGDKPVVGFKRVSDSWITNTHLGGRVEPIELDDEIYSICGKIINLLGEGFFGIDLLQDQDSGRYLVCEVNHNPEFAKSSQVHGVDIPEKLADYIDLRLGTAKTDFVQRLPYQLDRERILSNYSLRN